MLVIEILMIVIGLGAVIVSFRLSDDDKENDNDTAQIDLSEIEERMKQSVKETKEEILNKADEKFSKISNDKILGFSEYSEEVFKKIEKNHEETVFLYNMLTEKEKEIQKLIHNVDVTNADLRNESARIYQEVKKQLAEVDSVLKKLELESAKAINNNRAVNMNNISSANTMGFAESVNSNDSMMRRPVSEERVMSSAINKERVREQTEQEIPARTQVRRSVALDAAEMEAIAKITDSRERYISQDNNAFDEEDGQEEGKANSNSEIIALYKKGRSVLEISKMLSMGQGEVKLVIDLYNAR